jgi:hypothetical protein
VQGVQREDGGGGRKWSLHLTPNLAASTHNHVPIPASTWCGTRSLPWPTTQMSRRPWTLGRTRSWPWTTRGRWPPGRGTATTGEILAGVVRGLLAGCDVGLGM